MHSAQREKLTVPDVPSIWTNPSCTRLIDAVLVAEGGKFSSDVEHHRSHSNSWSMTSVLQCSHLRLTTPSGNEEHICNFVTIAAVSLFRTRSVPCFHPRCRRLMRMGLLIEETLAARDRQSGLFLAGDCLEFEASFPFDPG